MRLAPLLLALGLAACEGRQATEELRARAAAVDPPQLWRAEALGRDGEVQKAVLLCADTVLREGLARANAEVNGQPCRQEGDVQTRPGFYGLRCTAGGRRYVLSTTSWGDPRNDLTVSFAATALDRSHQAASQLRHYRRLGPCPAGWIVGQTGPAQ
jgi:hypothetical protein